MYVRGWLYNTVLGACVQGGGLSMCMPEGFYGVGFYGVALMLWSKQYYPVIFYSSSIV